MQQYNNIDYNIYNIYILLIIGLILISFSNIKEIIAIGGVQKLVDK